MDDQASRVFLSYSDDSPQHAARVRVLALWLREHGIDARIDQLEDTPEEGWPRWIYRQILESEFVLVVCSREYLVRCEGNLSRAGASKSVKFESHLSLQEIRDAESRNTKLVPVLFDNLDVAECVPQPLRDATFYRLPEQRDDLYRRLSDQPKVRASSVGALRTLDDDSFESLANALTPTSSSSLESMIDAAPAERSPRQANTRLVIAAAVGVVILIAVLLMSQLGS